jgi:hypothetical protein
MEDLDAPSFALINSPSVFSSITSSINSLCDDSSLQQSFSVVLNVLEAEEADI